MNKQYKEKEYFEIVSKIKGHMNTMSYIDEKGRIFKYGEFFPYDMCPFGYNETNAHDFFPLEKKKYWKKDIPGKIEKKEIIKSQKFIRTS